MILVLDVGNTNIVLGIYEGTELRHQWRLSTNRAATVDEYGLQVMALLRHAKLEAAQIQGVMVSSVVPPLQFVLEQLGEKYLQRRTHFVGPRTNTGLQILIDQPQEIGADRIVNAVAAIHKYGAPLIIVDFGTATTVCCIDSNGRYLGGAIAPGIGISTDALYQRAAKLPRIEMSPPPQAYGTNTIHAMQAGILFGFAGQVDGIVERIAETMETRPQVIATGGLAEMITGVSKTITVHDPHLTLDGLRLIYDRIVAG
jgi:type III pantothenate kinase